MKYPPRGPDGLFDPVPLQHDHLVPNERRNFWYMRPHARSRAIPNRWVGLLVVPLLLGLLLPGKAVASEPAASTWLDAARRPNASARVALQMLAEAPADGLVAQDYRAHELAELAATLDDTPDTTTVAEAFGDELDASMLRYLHDLQLGRVDPRALGFRVERIARERPDVAALLRTAAAEQNLPRAAADLRPPLGQYGKLREALARYRVLAAEAGPLPLLAIPPSARSVNPGDTFSQASALQGRLIALGDLPLDTPTPGELYEGALAEGVRRFQARHGLETDGKLGRTTVAALNVPLAQRVLQLELALERLRWLPDLGAGPFIGINLPMYRLWAWDPATPAAEQRVDMGVVVGRALNTQTPVLAEEMRYLIFRPYWNVPRSILHKEILPAIARHPGYLDQHDMEIVRGAGDNAQPVEANGDNLALLRAGVLRVRQRPGPKNSLGLAKFIFPNDNNVYLHDTPATQLFGRARRDFSHGCVRVEDPVALARWVLRDQPDWTRERIEAAMAGPSPVRVELTRPIPVILFYMTTMVMPSDSALHFAPDIYGHDTRLARALAKRNTSR